MTKILVVEDDLIIAEHLRITLKKMGYSPLGPASSAEEAVEVIDGEAPDLLLIDIWLKGEVDGISLAEYVKEKHSSIGFIFLTSHTDKITLNKAIKARPIGYLVKPFNQADLHTTIELGLHSISREKTNSWEKASQNIFFSKNEEVVKVPVEKIKWCQEFHGYIKVFTENDCFRVNSNFEKIEAKVPQLNFHKISDKTYVNLDAVERINHDSVRVRNKILKVEEPFKSALIRKLNMLDLSSSILGQKDHFYHNTTPFQKEPLPSISLTEREQEIIEGLSEGLSYKLVADKLKISIETVRHHIKKIYKKLNINSKGELISKYLNGEL